jgi:hypothetical protein
LPLQHWPSCAQVLPFDAQPPSLVEPPPELLVEPLYPLPEPLPPPDDEASVQVLDVSNMQV